MSCDKMPLIVELKAKNRIQMNFKVVILTGGREGHQRLLGDTDVKHKALLPVGEKPMVLSVFDAAVQSEYKPEIYISTDDSDIETMKTSVPFTALPSENSAVNSLVRSLERLPEDTDWALFISADHPLLTTEMVDYFVTEVLNSDLDFCAAVVGKKLVQQHYPESKRTYLPVKGDAFSGANMYMINKKAFGGRSEYLETVDKNRKAHWKSIFGLDFLSIIQGVFRQLTIQELVARANPLVGCRCGVIEMPWAECCMDVDKPSDKVIAEEILAKRKAEFERAESFSAENQASTAPH